MNALFDQGFFVFGIMPHMLWQDKIKIDINIVIHSHVTHELVKSEIHVSHVFNQSLVILVSSVRFSLLNICDFPILL